MDVKALVAEAAALLSSADIEQDSKRVREIPSVRAVRYYARQGLLSDPLGYSGRKAVYGQRHVLELIAIKRLQAEGATLAQIRAQLTDTADATLAQLAGLPEHASIPSQAPDDADDAFWRALPALPPTRPHARPAPAPVDPLYARIEGVRIAPGVTLTLEGGDSALTAADRQALMSAAAPLLRVIQARRLAHAQPPSQPAPEHDSKQTHT